MNRSLARAQLWGACLAIGCSFLAYMLVEPNVGIFIGPVLASLFVYFVQSREWRRAR